MRSCYKCLKSEDLTLDDSGMYKVELRPYGPKGQLVCFACGMRDPETTKVEFKKRLVAAGPLVHLSPDGPVPVLVPKNLPTGPKKS